MKLKYWLLKNNMTQSKFANIIKISKGNMCMIIKGLVKPSLKTLIKIKKATNGEVDVMDWDNTMEK